MALSKTNIGSAILLRPSGRLDHETSAEFEKDLVEAVRSCLVAVLDMSEVPYVSSVGLRAIMMAAKESKATKGSMAVAGLQPVVEEIFQISRFHFVVSIFPTVRDALTKLSPDDVNHL